MAGDVLQEVMATPEENDILKRLSRRRRRLGNERGRVVDLGPRVLRVETAATMLATLAIWA